MYKTIKLNSKLCITPNKDNNPELHNISFSENSKFRNGIFKFNCMFEDFHSNQILTRVIVFYSNKILQF